MTYNMTELQGVTTVYELVVYANNAADSILMTLFLVAVFFIMLMALKRWEFDNALLGSSFICFIIGIILNYSQLIALVWPLVFLVMSAFTAFYMFVLKA